MESPLPEVIQNRVHGLPWTGDSTGMSGAGVRLYHDMVLKIQADSMWARQEHAMLRWLAGRLPAPRLIAEAKEHGMLYLLESRLLGDMACSERYLQDPDQLLQDLADALRPLWDVPVQDCPLDQSPDALLEEATRRVEQGLVDMGNVDPSTFGPNGFRDPADLLDWLQRNKPALEDPVLVHGDLCLTNILFQDGTLSGFVDLPGAGVGDKWRDLAIVLRSLQDHMDSHYGHPHPDFRPDKLLDLLGIQPDPQRRRWYLLLDELF